MQYEMHFISFNDIKADVEHFQIDLPLFTNMHTIECFNKKENLCIC